MTTPTQPLSPPSRALCSAEEVHCAVLGCAQTRHQRKPRPFNDTTYPWTHPRFQQVLEPAHKHDNAYCDHHNPLVNQIKRLVREEEQRALARSSSTASQFSLNTESASFVPADNLDSLARSRSTISSPLSSLIAESDFSTDVDAQRTVVQRHSQDSWSQRSRRVSDRRSGSEPRASCRR